MNKALQSVKRADIRVRSGLEVKSHHTIESMRLGFFVRENQAVAGEAPKDFLRIYEYGRGRKSNPRTWPAHIAKVGQKYYPNESIMEQLLTRIGELLGLQMAKSRLLWVRGQLRFLSEYFLKPQESLVHGAQIFAGYLAEDIAFVEHVEEMKMSNEIFTFQVVEAAIKSRFPTQADAILREFVRLLTFDAIVGNNDRHFFNWGVITHVAGRRPPRFSPIYDSARALLWNQTEHSLMKHVGQFDDYLGRYVAASRPKTGWDHCKSLNHFELLLKIVKNKPLYHDVIKHLDVANLAERVDNLIGMEFENLMSPLRRKFVVGCLRMRLGKFTEIATL